MPDRPTLAFADDRSPGAERALSWIRPDPLDLTVNPGWTILDTVAQRRPDLVALGTRGRSGIERFWVGSVASAVVRLAPSPVLVARDGQRHEHHDDR